MEQPVICRNCGRVIAPNQSFCGGCGMSVMANSNPTDPYVGRLIDGKFLVEGLLGTGAMGVVYKAKHVALNREVAVKILRRSLLGDETVARRFKQEARAASRLNHPNTIQILDFGELPEVGLYMAMELLKGKDLGKIIHGDWPLPPGRIIHILSQVLSALAEAHGVGIIHRDVKPANIVVSDLRSQKDFVKVLDFGIAKIVDPEPGESLPMTREGFVCGTPAFMSPEQVQGSTLDPRTDLFSVGVVMYQMLTRELPFKGDSAVEMATQIVLGNPRDPRELRPDIPDGLVEVVTRALAKDRSRRYQDAGEMLRDLERVAQELGEPRPLESLQSMPRASASAPASVPEPEHGRGSEAGAVGARVETKTMTDLPDLVIEPPQDLPPGEPGRSTREMARLTMGNPARAALVMGLVVVLGLGAALLGQVVGRWLRDGRGTRPGGAGASARRAPEPAPPGSPSPGRPAAESPSGPVDVPPKAGQAAREPASGPGKEPSGERPGPVREARPTKPEPRRGRAREPRGRPPRAARPRRRATAPGPAKRSAASLHKEAMALMYKQDLEAALAKLRAAVKLEPRNPILFRDMGRVAMRAGHKRAALGYFERYLTLAPTAADAQVYRTIISNLEREGP